MSVELARMPVSSDRRIVISLSPGRAPRPPRAVGLQITTIDTVEPMDAQFGVAVKKTVPDALQEALFGPAGTDPEGLPPRGTFALLDAARITNLPEALEDSGLAHRCLFKDAAYEDLKTVAPWIVPLQDRNSFTRNLFTRGDAYWQLWDNQAGFYIRAHKSLDDLWRHFRKFTRIQTPEGKGYYLRFWDRSVLNAARRSRPDIEF